MEDAEFRDLPKKYAGTFFQYRAIGTEDWRTCYAEDIRIYYAETKEEVNHYIVRVSGEWLRSTEYEFKFDFPPIGVLNYKETVIIATKYPARQWKKAATGENFNIWLPMEWLMNSLYGAFKLPKSTVYGFKWTPSNIHELYSNKYFSYQKALLLLEEGKRIACAITEEFFVTNSHYNESVLLWRYGTMVAEIYPTHIKYLEEIFKQEVIDFFKRNENA